MVGAESWVNMPGTHLSSNRRDRRLKAELGMWLSVPQCGLGGTFPEGMRSILSTDVGWLMNKAVSVTGLAEYSQEEIQTEIERGGRVREMPCSFRKR